MNPIAALILATLYALAATAAMCVWVWTGAPFWFCAGIAYVAGGVSVVWLAVPP